MAKGSLVQLNSGLVAVIKTIDDGFVTLDSAGEPRYAKSAICKVLKTELKKGERIRTTSGIVGTIEDISDPHVVKILSGGTPLDIDRKAICEVLPAKAPGTP